LELFDHTGIPLSIYAEHPGNLVKVKKVGLSPKSRLTFILNWKDSNTKQDGKNGKLQGKSKAIL
jgi:hypothetical protein